MTETFAGTVTGVYELGLGDKLSAAAAVSDTVLHVYSVVDFDEDGGWLRLNDAILEYLTRDSDALTITLAAPLAVAAALDDVVDAWDLSNGQPLAVTKAVLDDVDGFSGKPVEAYVSQSIAHILSTTMREGKGETVILSRDQGSLEVVGVEGRQFALAALQYLQGGMTTRQSDDDTGVDILGADSGTPGVYVIGLNGNMIVLRDDGSEGILEFFSGITGETPGSLNPFIIAGTNPAVKLSSGSTPTASQEATLQLSADATAGVATVDAALVVMHDTEMVGDLHVEGPNGILVDTGNINATNGTNRRVIGDILRTLFPPTTTNSPNAWIGSAGDINKQTSLSRFKLDQEDVTLEDALGLLRVVTKTWYDRAEVEANGGSTDGLRRIAGAIAEDVEEHAPILAVYEDGELQGIAYDRAMALLVPIVKHLHDENTDLRDRVERLEEAVSRLLGKDNA